jgi:hypothetical protein
MQEGARVSRSDRRSKTASLWATCNSADCTMYSCSLQDGSGSGVGQEELAGADGSSLAATAGILRHDGSNHQHRVVPATHSSLWYAAVCVSYPPEATQQPCRQGSPAFTPLTCAEPPLRGSTCASRASSATNLPLARRSSAAVPKSSSFWRASSCVTCTPGLSPCSRWPRTRGGRVDSLLPLHGTAAAGRAVSGWDPQT